MTGDAWTDHDPTRCDRHGTYDCTDPACLGTEPAGPQRGRAALRFRSARDVISDPAPDPIIEGIAWEQCVTLWAAESGAGKTFVLIDLAAAVSAGTRWHGRDTCQGSVAYIAFEGDALNLRLRAARDRGGQRLDHVHILRAHDPLSPRVTREGEDCSPGERFLAGQLETLAATLAEQGAPPIRLIIIDTVRASLTGSEDSSEHVSAYLRAVRRLMAVVPCAAVILAHHAGWQDGVAAHKRERGSSAWRGNCDATLYLEAGDYDRDRDEAPLTLRTLKVRDGVKPPPLHLIRRRVELAVCDRRGRPLDSCIIEADRRSAEDVRAEQDRVVAKEARRLDVRVLRAMHDYPDSARSRDTIRALVNVAATQVQAAIARILQAGWALPPERQRQPYRITEAGQTILNTSPTGSDRLRPTDRSRSHD